MIIYLNTKDHVELIFNDIFVEQKKAKPVTRD